MRESYEKVPDTLYPVSLGGLVSHLPVYRSNMTGMLVAIEQQTQKTYAIEDDGRLIRGATSEA